MKKIITAGLLLICAYVNSYGQDSSTPDNRKLHPNTKNYGAYTVTTDNGAMSVAKNSNFDAKRALKRDTSRRSNSKIEIYYSGNNVPILKRLFIFDANSVSSESLMPKDDRIAKYGSQGGVLVIHLKPGVVTVGADELLSMFKVPKESVKLPIFVDYKQVGNSKDLLAIPNAVLKINVIEDTDGFEFLNVVTKSGEADRKKYAGSNIIQIK